MYIDNRYNRYIESYHIDDSEPILCMTDVRWCDKPNTEDNAIRNYELSESAGTEMS